MRGKKLLATLAVSAVLFAGCGLKSGEAIIKVNNTKITQAQFDQSFDKQAGGGLVAALGIDIKNDKNSFMYNLIKERVINELIVKALIEQEITKRGIKVTAKDVDDALKDIVNKVGSKEQLDMMLKQNGVTPADFKKDLSEEVKMKKLAEQLGNSTVTDADTQKFYKENIDKFKYPDKVRASHILITANPDELKEVVTSDPANKNLTPAQVEEKVKAAIKEKEAKAKALLAEAKKDPASFAKLAKENSEDKTSAEKGGDLGFFRKEEMVPEFAAAAFALKPNTVSETVIKTQYGYHIIYVTDRAAAGVEPYEKVKNDIKAYMENQKQLALLDDLTESLKKTAKIEYLNPSYDPANIRQEIQKQYQQSGEAAKKAKEAAQKK